MHKINLLPVSNLAMYYFCGIRIPQRGEERELYASSDKPNGCLGYEIWHIRVRRFNAWRL